MSTSEFSAARRRIQVSVEGTPIKTLPDVAISESMTQLTTVAEFTLAERMVTYPAPDDEVLIEWIDLEAETSTVMFAGTIDSIDVDSEPWSFRCRAVDQLEKLRRTNSSGNMVFEGETDKEVWEAIATYCNVTYDPDDIRDQEYPIGVYNPIYWSNDGQTTGAQMIQELDRVFRTMTLCIGNGRVIRIAYNPYPEDDTDMYRLYTKGVDIDFFSHQRNYGGRDRIQNVWLVTGATIQTSSACTSTPWAKAVDGNASLGRRVRVTEQSFQSDLIQDESLAVLIAQWKMGETNREPETASADLFNDPQVHPGTIIGVQDSTPGITAVPRYFLVTSVQRVGMLMSVELTAGPPGDSGTVTSGVDTVCNDEHTDTDQDDDFEWPGGFDPMPTTGEDPIDPGDFPDVGPGDPLEVMPLPVDEPIVCDEAVGTPFSFGTDSGPDEVSTNWRVYTGDWYYRTLEGAVSGPGSLVAILEDTSGVLIYNSNNDSATHSSADDVSHPAASAITVCADVALCGDNSVFQISLLRDDTNGVIDYVQWRAQPNGRQVTDALSFTDEFTGAISIAHGIVTNLNYGPNPLSNGAFNRNTGVYFPTGGGEGLEPSGPAATPADFTFFTLCAAFDLTDTANGYEHGYAFGTGGEGHSQSEICLTSGCVLPGEPLTYTPNPYDFKLALGGSGGYLTSTCPPVQIRDITIGQGNCEANPDYVDPEDR